MTEIVVEDLRSLLVTPMANGEDLSSATGFVVWFEGTTYLVTNWHVLAGRHSGTGAPLHSSGATPDALRIQHVLRTPLATRTEVVEPCRDEDGVAIWLEHPTLGRQVDVAGLPLTTTDRMLLDGYSLEVEDSPVHVVPGERLNVIGFPFGISSAQGLPVWTTAFAATYPDLPFQESPCFLIDARTREGQSGSPVIFHSSSGIYPAGRGQNVLTASGPTVTRFMGVYSGRVNPDSDLGRVWTPEAIKDVLAGAKTSSAL
ncbi:trypsin-like peptidase domain-containing protein [Aeromicrobium choanae]|uniref:Trypsin-like peptidase domain-containing protein n=1 Tax=Aeromicrobium choanae TaxID=1736691 RepID=A0A1T4YQT7_9ACTN|nr:trypsin-like peptidase domain-containing protein [Aeromicrobium choanae]SKB04142.1 Trypsin-like peptidase domain-containing protein [Aeromicrobium choanae]